MEFEKIPADRINPAKYNPRKNLKPGDPEYEKLKRSIREFGYVEPVIWNKRTGNIVGGHQRFKVLTEMGEKDIDCVVVDLEDGQEKALNIALNKVSGEWDSEALTELIKNLDDMNFDLSLTGFDLDELEELLQEEQVKEDDFDVEAALEEIETPMTKPGDIWVLGSHRLMCGDSTKQEHVAKLMGNELADINITDPPYNVDYEGGTGMKIKNDNMEDSKFFRFLFDAYTNMFEFARAGSPIYVFHADSEGHNFRKAFKESGWSLKQCLIWVKNSLVLGRQDYQWQHEPILYGWKEGAAHLWYGGRNKETVIEDSMDFSKLSKKELLDILKSLNEAKEHTTIIRENKPHKCDLHPTMKPLKLIEYLLRNSSKPEDTVLDLFGGSGSTLMTCEQMNRKCRTMEFDEKYADVIVQRFIELTGESSRVFLIRDGKEFNYEEAQQQ